MRRLWRLCSKPPWPRHQPVQHGLALVAEGGMAEIMGQRDGLGQVVVEFERGGDVAGDGGDFDGVGQPGAQVVAGAVEKDLGLVFQTAKRAGVDHAVAVALVFGAPERAGLRVGASAGVAAELGVRREDLAFDLSSFLGCAAWLRRWNGAIAPVNWPGLPARKARAIQTGGGWCPR